MSKLAELQNGVKKNPPSHDEDEEPIRRPSRQKGKVAPKKYVEESESEFQLSEGDVISDLDYEEKVPQKSAAFLP